MENPFTIKSYESKDLFCDRFVSASDLLMSTLSKLRLGQEPRLYRQATC